MNLKRIWNLKLIIITRIIFLSIVKFFHLQKGQINTYNNIKILEGRLDVYFHNGWTVVSHKNK